MDRYLRRLCAILALLLLAAGCARSAPAAVAPVPDSISKESSAAAPASPDVAEPSEEASETGDTQETNESTAPLDEELGTEPAAAIVAASTRAASAVDDDELLPSDQWPSFDCGRELDEIETLLCTRYQAAATDRSFAEFWAGYVAERAQHPLLDDLVALQTYWLTTRDACLDPEINEFHRDNCVRKVYLERQNALAYAQLVPQGDAPDDVWKLGWGPFDGTISVIGDDAAGGAGPAIEALVDLAQANLQVSFQQDWRFAHSSGSVDIAINQSHGQRLSAFGWSEAGFIQPSAHPYFNFNEFLYDRDREEFIDMSDLLGDDHHVDAAAVLVDAMAEVALQQGSLSYLRGLSLDELTFTPVFDANGMIVAFSNNALAESLGSYAGRFCFYGLEVPAARLVDFADAEYADLFAANLVDGPVLVPDCEG